MTLRRNLFTFADWLRGPVYAINQNPQYLEAADRIEHTAEHGDDQAVIREHNRILRGIALIVELPN